MGGRRRYDLAGEQGAEVVVAAVEGFDGIHVGAHVSSVQGCSDECTLGTGVSEDAGLHLPVSAGAGITTERHVASSGVSSDFPIGLEQLLGSLVVHKEHDEVDALDADLRSPTAPGDDEERGSAPAFLGAAGCYD